MSAQVAATYRLRQWAIVRRPLVGRAARRWCTARGAILPCSASSFACSCLHRLDHRNVIPPAYRREVCGDGQQIRELPEAIGRRNTPPSWKLISEMPRPSSRKIAAMTFWNQMPRGAPRNAPILRRESSEIITNGGGFGGLPRQRTECAAALPPDRGNPETQPENFNPSRNQPQEHGRD